MEVLADLLQLETNLAHAAVMLDTERQPSLLVSHLERFGVQGGASSHGEISTDEIKQLLELDGVFNLSLSCAECNQTLFYDDDCAASGSLKEGLQSCCHTTLDHSRKSSDLDISFWWFFLNSFSRCILTLPNYTRLMLTNGVPPQLRNRVWGVATHSADAQGVADCYMKTLYESLNKDVSPDISIIAKDVNRTFPHLSMFTSYETKVHFENILNSYSIFDSDMGYCQGVQFIVAPMLFHFQDELKAFNALVKLFEVNNLRTIYDTEMSGLNLWFYQFEKIMELELPELHNHFIELDIDMNMFLAQWFLSFHSITMPFNFLMRMFDVLLMEGAKETLIRVGITLLSKNGKLLQSIDDQELIYQHLLSENCWGILQGDVDGFFSSVMSLTVDNFTQDHLNGLEEQFENLDKKKHSNKSFFNKFLKNFRSTAESVLSSSMEQTSASHSRSTMFSSANSSQISMHNEADFELVEGLYKLCLEKGVDDPLLSRLKDRLYA